MGIVILEAGEWLFNSSSLDSDASSKLDSILLHPVSTISLTDRTKLRTEWRVTLRVALTWVGWGAEGTCNPFLVLLLKTSPTLSVERMLLG